MNLRYARLGFSIFWFAIGIGIIGRMYFDQDWANRQGSTFQLGAILAVAFACWNLVRFLSMSPTPTDELPVHRRPLEPKRDADRPDEYNPEFDFSKQDAKPGDANKTGP